LVDVLWSEAWFGHWALKQLLFACRKKATVYAVYFEQALYIRLIDPTKPNPSTKPWSVLLAT